MKRVLLSGALLAVVAACWCPRAALAAEPAATAPSTKAQVPGTELAHAISEITGVAISPLLGVSAVGVWKYYHAPPQQRGRLPWFAQPWFWVPALVLVAYRIFGQEGGVSASFERAMGRV